MKKMKKQFALLLLFIAFISFENLLAQPAKMQQNGERNEAMKKKSEELKGKLNLSEPQAAKYDEILKRNRNEAKTKMMALPENAEPKERRTIMEQSLKNADLEIMEILDTEQQTIYKAEKDKMKEEVKTKRKKK
ncbi:MAG: hypothetical protein SGJ00_11755 [bacterium]|nr:hypothetical protein [bacterium]